MDRPFDPGEPAAFRAPRELDVLVPSRNRSTELIATLSGLAAQGSRAGAGRFGVVVSDQSDERPVWSHPAVAGMVRILRHLGHPVLLDWHQPRRGIAENRSHLLSRSQARYVLFVDDDVWLEPGTVGRLLTAIRSLGCGLVGNFPHGLSYVDEYRPGQECGYEEWNDRPEPERIVPRGPEWVRASVHAAANLLHVQQRLRLRPDEWRPYKIAWIGACAMFDRAKLVACGGYDFWHRVPVHHQGEDVLAQLRVLARYGGAGILPSGAYHLETPTTVPDRDVECFDVIPPHGATVG
jgi:glycosyltransferase involved in cell wall biosynthesis